MSTLWMRRYGQPRRQDGTYAPGFFLWKRQDGQSRWLYYPAIGPDDLADMRWLSDEGHRVLMHLVLVIVAAALVFWFG